MSHLFEALLLSFFVSGKMAEKQTAAMMQQKKEEQSYAKGKDV
jgi:hypothetical protein